jgi:hypothetical protein
VSVEGVGRQQIVERALTEPGEAPRPGPHHGLTPRRATLSELLDLAGGDVLGRVGVALDVPLRALAEPAFQLVGAGTGHLGDVEGEGVAQVVRPEQ